MCCPYLRSADGTWRSVVPQRGQRCWGQTPPAPLEPITQEGCAAPRHTRAARSSLQSRQAARMPSRAITFPASAWMAASAYWSGQRRWSSTRPCTRVQFNRQPTPRVAAALAGRRRRRPGGVAGRPRWAPVRSRPNRHRPSPSPRRAWKRAPRKPDPEQHPQPIQLAGLDAAAERTRGQPTAVGAAPDGHAWSILDARHRTAVPRQAGRHPGHHRRQVPGEEESDPGRQQPRQSAGAAPMAISSTSRSRRSRISAGSPGRTWSRSRPARSR